MNWKQVFKEIGNIQLYQNEVCIIIWYGNTHHTYWDYTQAQAVRLFKKKYGIKGKVDKTAFCPYAL